MSGLKVFISHHHEEKRLATGWQSLINTMTLGAVMPWYSSDDRAEGGTGTGKWRDRIQKEVQAADIIVVIVTPLSNEKPWLFWESGFAAGHGKEIIPVVYYMKPDQLHSVFTDTSAFEGDREDEVEKLCGKLMLKHLGAEPPAEARASWSGWIEKYMQGVNEERETSFERALFQDHFHDGKIAENISGLWYAKWTQIHDDGHEDVFEVDNLTIWSTKNRIRMVGWSKKLGEDGVSIEEQQDEPHKHYPMEGVVSPSGWIALSYWSSENIPICGTALLRPKGSSGGLLVGTWQGFTARSLDDDSTYTHGRVVMTKNIEVAQTYWSELE